MVAVIQEKGTPIVLVLATGDHITLKYKEVSKGEVAFDIDAPEDILILTDEVLDLGKIDLNTPIEAQTS